MGNTGAAVLVLEQTSRHIDEEIYTQQCIN